VANGYGKKEYRYITQGTVGGKKQENI